MRQKRRMIILRRLTWSGALVSAPAWTSARTTASCPRPAATSSGVTPSCGQRTDCQPSVYHRQHQAVSIYYCQHQVVSTHPVVSTLTVSIQRRPSITVSTSPAATGSGVTPSCGRRADFISLKVFLKSFCRSQFSHESVNLLFILVIADDKLTDLWGSSLLQNDFNLCEIRLTRQHTSLSVYDCRHTAPSVYHSQLTAPSIYHCQHTAPSVYHCLHKSASIYLAVRIQRRHSILRHAGASHP